MSYQDRPTPSEPATDDPRDRLERSRPEQGVGQEGASAGDRARRLRRPARKRPGRSRRRRASRPARWPRRPRTSSRGGARGQRTAAGSRAISPGVAQPGQRAGRSAGAGVERCQPAAALDGRERGAGCRQRHGPRGGGAYAGDFRTSQRGGIDGVLGQLRSVGRNRPGLFLFRALGVGLVAGRVVRNLAQEPSDNGSSDVGPRVAAPSAVRSGRGTRGRRGPEPARRHPWHRTTRRSPRRRRPTRHEGVEVSADELTARPPGSSAQTIRPSR